MKYNLIILIIILGSFHSRMNGQIINLGCQSDLDATIGLDRKDFNGGSTVNHSEIYMNNFDLPDNTFGDCKVISNVEINFTIISVDDSPLPAGCNIFNYFVNIYQDCPSYDPASCPIPNLLVEDQGSLSDTDYNIGLPGTSFQFGETLGFDIAPAMGTINCMDGADVVGQQMISLGYITLEYEVCVTVTVEDLDNDIDLDLGDDVVICGGGTTELDASDDYDEYEWSPGGETTAQITVGEGIYQVTVTDENGCTASDEIEVTSNSPTIDVTSDGNLTDICYDATIELTATTSGGNVDWSNGDSGDVITVGPGNYVATVTDIDGCTASSDIAIGQFDEPTVNINSLDPIVCGTETIELSATTGFVMYDWSNGDDTEMVDVGSGDYTVTITDSNNCTSSASLTVDGVAEPNAGFSNDLEVCNDLSFYNLDAVLGVNDGGGDWDDIDGTGVDLSDPFNVQFTGVLSGVYVFSYTVAGTSPCDDDVAIVTVEVDEIPNPGISNSVTVCNSGETLNFNDLIGVHDDFGIWIDEDNSLVDLSDLNSVSFEDVPLDTYVFTYEIQGVGPCDDVESTLTVVVENGSNAGDSTSETVCQGQILNLTDLISSDADQTGDFSDPSNSGALNGNLFTSTGLAGQTIDIIYSVDDSSCGNSTATFSITVTSSVNAGADNLVIVCTQLTVDLEDFIDDADPGGTFTDNSGTGELVGTIVNVENLGVGTYIFEYTVGDMSACGEDSSLITIQVGDLPDISLSMNNPTLCSNECDTLFINFIGTPSFTYTLNIFDDQNNSTDNFLNVSNQNSAFYHICNDGGNGTFLNDTIHIGNGSDYWDIFPEGITDGLCPLGQVMNVDTIRVIPIFAQDSTINEMLCPGDSIEVNGVVYNQLNPNGVETLFGQSSGGCDSIVTIDLMFGGNVMVLIDDTICSTDSIVVNGVVYNSTNAVGQETINTGSCDSIVDIDLSFYDLADSLINLILCPGDSIEVNNVVYNELNPNGMETLVGLSSNGCDSIVMIDLMFDGNVMVLIDDILCSTDSIVVNGVVYNSTNAVGQETINTGSCDSIVDIDLSFYATADSLINLTLCPGDSIEVNNVIYNELNPNGMETLVGLSSNGCDSIVTIDLMFGGNIMILLDDTICSTDSIVVNGVVYNVGNSSGQETINTGSCDSIVDIDLSFYATADSLINLTLCPGDSIEVNNVIYNELNPNGMETLVGQSSNGCDSLVTIDLMFGGNIMVLIDDTICSTDSIVVNGVVYNMGNSSGQETINTGSCDSIVDIDLSFYAMADSLISQTLCPGDSIEVNNVIYNESNPTGMETLMGASSNGCDSTVTIDLLFGGDIMVLIDDTICLTDSIIVNGVVYNEANSTGQEIINTSSCDSIINVSLSFFALAESVVSQTLCVGDSIIVNGVVYNESNPTGIETLMGQSSNGCDSLITINLDFNDNFSINETAAICTGDSILLAGEFQNMAGVYTDSLLTIFGCDSLIITTLSIDDCTTPVTVSGVNNICGGEENGVVTIEVLGTDFPYSLCVTGLTSAFSEKQTILDQNQISIANLISDVYEIIIISVQGDTVYNDETLIQDENQAITTVIMETQSISCFDAQDGVLTAETMGGNGVYSYEWSDAMISTPELPMLSGGSYSVTVEDTNGCKDSSDYILMAPEQLSFTINVNNNPCSESDATGEVSILNVSGGSEPYTFSIEGGPFSSNLVFDNLLSGDYQITMMDVNGCMLSQMANLNPMFDPASFINSDPIYSIMEGDSVLLDNILLLQVDSVLWSDSVSLSCLGCLTPIASPLETTVYEMQIFINGCSFIQEVIVEVIPQANEVFIPTAFSPDDNFGNTTFAPIFIGSSMNDDVEFSIYDRWGSKVYSYSGIASNFIAWDGRMNGQDLNQGVYIYQLVVKNANNEKSYFGDITLIR